MADQNLFSIEAEQAVIGGLFVAPVKFAEVAERVREADFSRQDHRLIFAAMRRVAQTTAGMDIVTVGEAIDAAGHSEAAPFEYLVTLAHDTPSAANVLAYADIVRNRAQCRRLLQLADQLADWTRQDRDAAKTAERMRQALNTLDQPQGSPSVRALRDILPDVLDDLDKRAHRTQSLLGHSTGLADVDTLLDGLCAGRLYVVAGRPSSGKSVFGLQCARQAFLARQNVVFFSLEMPAAEVVHRLMASGIPLDLGRIQSARLSDEDWLQIAQHTEQLANAQLWIDDSSQLSIGDLQTRARQLHRKHPLGLVVVDYIGLMDGERAGDYSNRVQEISSITRALKQLAKELNCPVMALAQLNRKLEDRSDKRPILSDLRESGSVEQDADVVMMVYRDELHNPESPDKGCAELWIRKNRGGPIGMAAMAFQGAYCRFMPLAGRLPSRDAPPPSARSRGYRRRDTE
jgi:replicative DNA helicase